ncbi:hypothetical protein FGG08_005571 [Glutinoglossum americanum]|uniref:NACHT domain-containing protein n=1 Tax=Glutinoglossum americanum TaxID=1670608 RepID=A0A9P8I306_9PEZI|nr:hypothetical protein FGG08_005571 [Glutinoglossum americanum]
MDDHQKIWLRDFLPSQVQNARVMSYGYNSIVAFSKSIAGIDEFAEDLLNRLDDERETAQAILAHERSSLYSEFLRRVWGVVFMGTPHRGSDVAFWTDFLARVLHTVQLGTRTNKELVSALKRDSKVLSDISHQFTDRGANLQIRTFYETELFEYMNCLIVSKDSACLGLPNEISTPIQANHKTICRFSSADSQRYRPVWKAIKKLVGAAPHDCVADLHHVPPKAQIRCLRCLRTSDYDSYKETIVPRADGTCIWFLQHPKYLAWLKEEKSSLLWVSGDPGCGKTVLSSFLVDELKGTGSQATLPATVCFFFCDDKIESQKDGKEVLSGLLHQLFSANRPLIRHAMRHFEAKGSQMVKDMKALWDILRTASDDPEAGNIICVIDALDECEEPSRRLLIKWFVDYLTTSTPLNRSFLKVIMTSRGYPSIEIAFHSVSSVRLKAEDMTDSISADISRVIQKRLREVASLTSCSEQTRSRIERRLTENADRTFLWVSLILELLENSTEASEEAFDRMTTTLPRRLDEVYKKILQGVSSQERTKKALTVLVATSRPLTLTELNMVLNIRETDRSRSDVEPRLEPAMDRTIKGLCGPFVRVIDSKVYLVHQTAKEFLIKSSNTVAPIGDSWGHCLDLADSNLALAKVCIWYLSFDVFEQPPSISSEAEARQQIEYFAKSHDFLDYAANYWAIHLRRSGAQGEQALLKSTLGLCDTQSGRFLTWFQVYWTTISDMPLCPQDMTTLMVASYFGHKAVVRLLLDRGVDVAAQDSEGWTALHWAVWEGRGETWEGCEAVQPLLAANADVSVTDGWGMTALHWAAADGQEAIIRLLQDAGSDAAALDSEGWAPSHHAAKNGHQGAVKLFVETGVDVDAKDGGGRTMLHLSATSGHEGVVRLLVEKKADIAARDEGGKTALQFAAENGHKGIMRLLMEEGADLEATDG